MRYRDDWVKWMRLNELTANENFKRTKEVAELARLFFGEEDTPEIKGKVRAEFNQYIVNYSSALSCCNDFDLTLEELSDYIVHQRKHKEGCRFKQGNRKPSYYLVIDQWGNRHKYKDSKAIAREYRVTESSVRKWARQRKPIKSIGLANGIQVYAMK